MPLQNFGQFAEQLTRGDARTWKPLLEQYAQGCLNHLAGMGVSRPLADDIMLDAVLELAEKIRSGEVSCPADVEGFLHKACERIYRIRHAGPNSGLADDLHYYFAKNVGGGAVSLEGGMQEKMRMFQTAFNSLGEKGRELLRLLYVEEKDLAQAAAILGYGSEAELDELRWKCLARVLQTVQLQLKTSSRRR